MRQRNLGAGGGLAGLGLAWAGPVQAQAADAASSVQAVAAGNAWLTLVPRIEYATATLLLAVVGLLLVLRAFRSSAAGGFSIRRHAGGFGGSSTGWTISYPLTSLLTGFALFVLAGALAMAPVAVKDDAKAGDEAKAAVHDDKAGASAPAGGAASEPASAAASAARK